MAALFGDVPAAAAHCWQMLVRATRDRKSDWRTPVLSTIGLDGAPRARVLVLRKVEPQPGLLWIHTDSRSAKVAELAAEPRAALTFWDARRSLQLRVEGEAQFLTDAARLAEAWARVPDASRRNYATVQPPGSVDDGSAALPAVGPTGDGESNFAMGAIRADRLEWLWLGPDRHLRGESRRQADGWESRALIP